MRSRAEQSRAEQKRGEQSGAEESRAEESRAEESRAEQRVSTTERTIEHTAPTSERDRQLVGRWLRVRGTVRDTVAGRRREI